MCHYRLPGMIEALSRDTVESPPAEPSGQESLVDTRPSKPTGVGTGPIAIRAEAESGTSTR